MPATSDVGGPWAEIQYTRPTPPTFWVPEHHWPGFLGAGLSEPQRVRLNHLACTFMCEMFVHFERYILDYIEGSRPQLRTVVSDTALDRFVAEEVDHTVAFFRLLELIAPDDYPTRKLRFLKWGFIDRLIMRFMPLPGFFFTAALFEEMTLYVPVVMAEKLDESFKPILDVMELHAKEERGHVGLDIKILRTYRDRRPRWLYALQILTSIPVIVHVDKAVARAWRRQAKAFGQTEGLTRAQIKQIANRGPSTSDVMGIHSFIAKLRKHPVPGSRLVCRLIELFTP